MGKDERYKDVIERVKLIGGIANLAQSLFFDDYCNQKKFLTRKKGRPREILKNCLRKKLFRLTGATGNYASVDGIPIYGFLTIVVR
jgi:hypothetical protein